MAIESSKTLETIIVECGGEFYDAIRFNKQYRDSRWDMKFAPSTCKYNMFGVTVAPGIFQWIVATKWAEVGTQTNGNGGVFASGAPAGKGLEIFDSFFPFPLTSALPEARGAVDSGQFTRQIGFYEKKRNERNDMTRPEMNMEFKVVSKANGGNGRPVRGYVMNLHVTSAVDTNRMDAAQVFQTFGFTLTDPSGDATTIRL